jgi:hypothetical protein
MKAGASLTAPILDVAAPEPVAAVTRGVEVGVVVSARPYRAEDMHSESRFNKVGRRALFVRVGRGCRRGRPWQSELIRSGRGLCPRPRSFQLGHPANDRRRGLATPSLSHSSDRSEFEQRRTTSRERTNTRGGRFRGCSAFSMSASTASLYPDSGLLTLAQQTRHHASCTQPGRCAE